MAAGGFFGTLAMLASLGLTSGCSTVGYYAQAAAGHADVMRRSRPVADWLADPGTPPALRSRLILSQRLRDFAATELKLPDNSSYRRFADLERPAAVWNVVAAPALSLTLKTWCFPVMGCVGYRGFFDRGAADALAAQLRAEGLEVSVYGVPAYSTLGFSNWLGGDPLLNTFIGWPEGELARMIFHELAHQVAYAADDTTFNESFATAVERIGARAWLQHRADSAALAEQQRTDERRQQFRQLALRWRGALETLYAAELPTAEKLERKAELMAALRADFALIKAERWGGFAGYDDWLARANNASFGVLAAYNELVPEFERLFERSGRDHQAFHAQVRVLAALPREQRRAKLIVEP